MNEWGDIKEQIYTLLGNITTTVEVDSPNYDWQTRRRIDKYVKRGAKVTATIHYPEDSPFEVNVSEEEKAMSGEEICRRDIQIKCSIVSESLRVDPETIIDENNDALDKTLRDLQSAMANQYLNTCGLGVYKVYYADANKEKIEGKSAYYPFLLNAEYSIYYRVARC